MGDEFVKSPTGSEQAQPCSSLGEVSGCLPDGRVPRDAYHALEIKFRQFQDFETLRADESVFADVVDLERSRAQASISFVVGEKPTIVHELRNTAAGAGVFLLPGVLSPDLQLELTAKLLGEWRYPPNRTNLWPPATEGCASAGGGNFVAKGESGNATSNLQKLRWVTLGRQYDWTSRRYIDEADGANHQTHCLPEELRRVAASICAALSDPSEDEAKVCPGGCCEFDAAIGNLYHAALRPSDRLGGHQDDAEEDDGSPLVSLSLGLPCIFLLGGRERTQQPTPVLLRSGDALVLRGDARRAYHGVPTVLVPPRLQSQAAKKLRRVTRPPPLSEEEQVAVYEPWALAGARPHAPTLLAQQSVVGVDVLEFLRRTRLNFSIRSSGQHRRN